MLLPEMISRMRVELSDPESPTTEVWEEEDLENCIVKATSDLSRVLPREKMLDVTLLFTVTDEDITTHATILITPITLASQMVKPLTDVVKNVAGTTTYIRDIDYTMDYVNGVMTPKVGGALVINTSYHISYTKIKIGFSIANISDELLRIEAVEYPAGSVPQKFVSYKRWGDYVYVTSSETDSQAEMSTTSHIFVFYFAEHDPASSIDHASYPLFLDSVVILGSVSYALFMRVLKLINSAITLNTAASTAFTAANVELAKIAANASSVESKIDAITEIDTHLTGVTNSAVASLGAIAAALTLAETALGKITTSIGYGQAYLELGDDLINVAPKGLNVAENYYHYAETEVQNATAFGREADSRLSEVTALMNKAQTQIQIANALAAKDNLLSQRYGDAAQLRIQSATQYISEGFQNLQSATIMVNIAERIKIEASSRRDEFWAILKDKMQLRMPTSVSDVKQIKS